MSPSALGFIRPMRLGWSWASGRVERASTLASILGKAQERHMRAQGISAKPPVFSKPNSRAPNPLAFLRLGLGDLGKLPRVVCELQPQSMYQLEMPDSADPPRRIRGRNGTMRSSSAAPKAYGSRWLGVSLYNETPKIGPRMRAIAAAD